MTATVTKKKKTGRRQIDIVNLWELDYWSRRFACSQQQLIAAVKKAGTSPVKVARELEK